MGFFPSPHFSIFQYYMDICKKYIKIIRRILYFVNLYITLFKNKIIFDIIFLSQFQQNNQIKRGRNCVLFFINLLLVVHALHLILQVTSHQHLRRLLPTLLQYQRRRVITLTLLPLMQI